MGPHPPTHPTDERVLLLLLYQNEQEPIEGITRLQKLIFLIQEEIGELEKSFQFEPYDYGPFSQDLYTEVDELVRRGLIRRIDDETPSGNERYSFKITEEGIDYLYEEADEEIRTGDIGDKISQIKQEYNSMSILALLDEIYEDFEDYAAESVIYKY